MSFKLEFERDSQLIYIQAHDNIDLNSILAGLTRLESEGRSENGLGIIFDATQNDHVPNRQDVDVFSTSEAWRKVIERYAVAIVVSKPIQFGIANVLARKSEAIGGRVERFYSVDSARAWLEKIGAEKLKTLKAGS